ncbi:hypothetical protein [Candidatus Binatus sp.]|uniref:hypothetical protein n=1 Tax=Candidatus Binatus sp. TaxID=2811406 RepID=UPI003F95017A
MFYEIQPYRLGGEHKDKWALTITRCMTDSSGMTEQPLYGGPIFDGELDALKYGVGWVARHHGRVRKSVLAAIAASSRESLPQQRV